MKKKFLLFFLMVTSVIFSGLTLKAQAVDVQDSLALVDLYNSTNGPGWGNHTNWLTLQPVSSWFGVTVTGSRVTSLSFYRNNLAGYLPSSIGNLTALSYLGITQDALTDTIPSSVGNLTSLNFLDLGSNELTGNIPASISNLINLTHLSLEGNKLSGTIPVTLGNLINLTELELGFNRLTGTIPSTFGNLKQVYLLGLGQNRLSGKIPSSIGNMTSLQLFDVFQNNLTGAIPGSFSKLKNLAAITAYSNHLFQPTNVQFSTAKLPNLSSVLIYYNNFNFNGLESLVANVQYVSYGAEANLTIHQSTNTLSVSAGGTLSNNTYKWYMVGQANPVVIVGDSVFHPTQSGMYYATVTNAIATKLTLATDTVSYTASFANITTLPLSVSPNPVKDILMIKGLPKAQGKIAITDSYGNVRLSASYKGEPGVRYNVSNLKAGIYLVTFTNKSGISTVKFIKD